MSGLAFAGFGRLSPADKDGFGRGKAVKDHDQAWETRRLIACMGDGIACGKARKARRAKKYCWPRRLCGREAENRS